MTSESSSTTHPPCRVPCRGEFSLRYGTSKDRYGAFEYTDSAWGDLLTKYNNTTITYDTIGNPFSYRDGITMTWKNGRRLATFTKGDVSASFDYDADGLRTTKTVGTSRVDYYRAGGLLLGEVHTDGDESYTINYMYDESGRMLGFRLDGEEYYYVRDYAGDVTGLINARGELIGSYLYDPWGVLLETYLNTFEEETAEWTDADRAEYMRVLNLNPIRYKSYYYDTETGFYYLQSRYYDPITTRFINADGLISTGTGVLGYNMFVYCNNNPIMYFDFNGNCPGTVEHIRACFVGREVCEKKHTAKELNMLLRDGWTYSWGIDFSLSALDYGFSGSISVVFTKDEIGLQFSQCLPQDTSGRSYGYVYGWDVGACMTTQYTEFGTLGQLEGNYRTDTCSLTNIGILTRSNNEHFDVMGWQFSAPLFGTSANYSQRSYDTTTLFTIPTFDLVDKLRKLFS